MLSRSLGRFGDLAHFKCLPILAEMVLYYHFRQDSVWLAISAVEAVRCKYNGLQASQWELRDVDWLDCNWKSRKWQKNKKVFSYSNFTENKLTSNFFAPSADAAHYGVLTETSTHDVMCADDVIFNEKLEISETHRHFDWLIPPHWLPVQKNFTSGC